MFGRSLAETIKFETRRGGGFVPLVVSKCVEFIKTYGKRSAIYNVKCHQFIIIHGQFRVVAHKQVKKSIDKCCTFVCDCLT